MNAERRAHVRGGVFGGLVASLGALGPVLGAACLSCVGVGGAVAGATLAVPAPGAILAGVAVLAVAGWRSLVRARRACGRSACRGVPILTVLTLVVTALGSYLLVTYVVLPVIIRALVELSAVFSHRPVLP